MTLAVLDLKYIMKKKKSNLISFITVLYKNAYNHFNRENRIKKNKRISIHEFV